MHCADKLASDVRFKNPQSIPIHFGPELHTPWDFPSAVLSFFKPHLTCYKLVLTILMNW